MLELASSPQHRTVVIHVEELRINPNDEEGGFRPPSGRSGGPQSSQELTKSLLSWSKIDHKILLL